MEILTKQYQTIMRKKWRGALAPPTCLECTCQSVKLPYEDGMQHEQKALDFLQSSGTETLSFILLNILRQN